MYSGWLWSWHTFGKRNKVTLFSPWLTLWHSWQRVAAVEITCDHKPLAAVLSETSSSPSLKKDLLLPCFNLSRRSVNHSLLAEALKSQMIQCSISTWSMFVSDCVYPMTVDDAPREESLQPEQEQTHICDRRGDPLATTLFLSLSH